MIAWGSIKTGQSPVWAMRCEPPTPIATPLCVYMTGTLTTRDQRADAMIELTSTGLGSQTTTALAGFHTVDSFESLFMGTKFQGHGINGYCTLRKQYFTYWTDSMTSSPLVAYGDYDAAKGELDLKGECLGMSGKLEPCRIVTR